MRCVRFEKSAEGLERKGLAGTVFAETCGSTIAKGKYPETALRSANARRSRAYGGAWRATTEEARRARDENDRLQFTLEVSTKGGGLSIL